MDQTRLVWVVSNVGQDLIDGVGPLLDDFHVEGEESLPATRVKAFSLRLKREMVFIPLRDRHGTSGPSSRD